MCEYFCIGFIDFMLVVKSLVDYNSLFLPYDFKNNDKIILNYFKKQSAICFFKSNFTV